MHGGLRRQRVTHVEGGQDCLVFLKRQRPGFRCLEASAHVVGHRAMTLVEQVGDNIRQHGITRLLRNRQVELAILINGLRPSAISARIDSRMPLNVSMKGSVTAAAALDDDGTFNHGACLHQFRRAFAEGSLPLDGLAGDKA